MVTYDDPLSRYRVRIVPLSVFEDVGFAVAMRRLTRPAMYGVATLCIVSYSAAKLSYV